ncbi:LOW QUALITY PROTEIN: hypothetical protein U9M48_008671 [Paspalum notatum var. saurae]|uniref:Uncharacterized protein n=1 Tax=Paspalum notatum var. saurae TaxID=547442 RepID=A0AAQ3SPJ5_PASNO
MLGLIVDGYPPAPPAPPNPPSSASTRPRATHEPDRSPYRLLHRRFERKPPCTAVPWPSRFNAATPPLLSTSGDEGKRKPAAGNTLPHHLGSKTGPHAASGAPLFPPLHAGQTPLSKIRDQEPSAWSYVNQRWSRRPTKPKARPGVPISRVWKKELPKGSRGTCQFVSKDDHGGLSVMP